MCLYYSYDATLCLGPPDDHTTRASSVTHNPPVDNDDDDDDDEPSVLEALSDDQLARRPSFKCVTIFINCKTLTKMKAPRVLMPRWRH